MPSHVWSVYSCFIEGNIIVDLVATLLDHKDAICIFTQKLSKDEKLFPEFTLDNLPLCE